MRYLIGAIFLFITLMIYRPILGYVWYPVHDTTSIARTYLLNDTLAHGQIPAVWANSIQYPLFHFYAPLFTYLSLGLRYITGSYFWGIKLTLMLSTLMGMVGIYILARRWGRSAALISSIAFALFPYAAVNLYVRGAFAEYLSYNLLPWVFWSWGRIANPRSGLTAGAITALFVLSHNLIPLITAPFLLGWIILLHSRSLLRLVTPSIIALGLSAFFLLPLIFERHFVVADAIAQTTDYSLHFVAPTQLWNSLWGFGGSAPGLEDGMSFKLGKVHLGLAILGILLLLRSHKKPQRYLFLTLILSLFMTTAYSQFLWRSIPFLPVVQFPWRFLTLAGFTLSLLAGYSVTAISPKLLRTCFVVIATSLLMFLNLKLFKPQSIFPADINQFTNATYLGKIPSIIPEYQPVWLTHNYPEQPNSTMIVTPYYPTWKVKLDGQLVTTYPVLNGYLAFNNPTNSTNYYAYQGHTQLEIIANLLSLLTLISIIALTIYARKN